MVSLTLELHGDVERLLDPPRLGLAHGRGDVSGETAGSVAWVVVEGGEGVLEVGALSAVVQGRSDVFDGPGWSASVGPHCRFALRGALRWSLFWRPGGDGPTQILDPAGVVEDQRGCGPDRRTVRTYRPEGSIIAGETVAPGGGWSSYPPHRHEHEEVYLFRFSDPGGFGVAMEYDEGRDEARRVKDGDVERIRGGYHPVVSAPGYPMCYLWALAGESDTLAPELDPLHASLP